jgi:hypothetical protein
MPDLQRQPTVLRVKVVADAADDAAAGSCGGDPRPQLGAAVHSVGFPPHILQTKEISALLRRVSRGSSTHPPSRSCARRAHLDE